MEGRGPPEATVRLKLHAEKWIWDTGEIVVVNACVNEGSGYANLLR